MDNGVLDEGKKFLFFIRRRVVGIMEKFTDDSVRKRDEIFDRICKRFLFLNRTPVAHNDQVLFYRVYTIIYPRVVRKWKYLLDDSVRKE